MKNVIEHSVRVLRRQMTIAERQLWYQIRDRRFLGYKFKRQYVIDYYIVDFICLEKKVVVEIDGSQHQFQMNYDEIRTKRIESRGFRLIRFWNNDVLTRISSVLEALRVFMGGEN